MKGDAKFQETGDFKHIGYIGENGMIFIKTGNIKV